MEVDHVDLKAQAGGTNAYCVILGRIGTDPLNIIGPFATENDAEAHRQVHLNAGVSSAVVDILVNPENC